MLGLVPVDLSRELERAENPFPGPCVNPKFPEIQPDRIPVCQVRSFQAGSELIPLKDGMFPDKFLYAPEDSELADHPVDEDDLSRC